MSKIEELEAKLAAKRAERDAAESDQYEKDLEARLTLEDEHGALAAVKVSRHVAGQPTRAFVRSPSSAEYKRYKDRVHRAVASQKTNVTEVQAASEQLARVCWVYPGTEDAKTAMLEAYPGLLSSISVAATTLAEGKAEEEGKD